MRQQWMPKARQRSRVGLRRMMCAVSALAIAMGPTGPALTQALPSGAQVQAGDVAITGTGSGLLISQGTATGIVGWNDFSVGAGRTVHFDNGTGATLNRVTGALPTSIDGTVTGTGSVYLVNRAGIAVGTGGMIATGGSFVGSTHDISDSDFLNGGDALFSGDSRAGVVNRGLISSAMGDVALIARRVENSGTLLAPEGTVGLAAGYEVLMQDVSGAGGKFAVQIGGADTEVVNRGAIRAAEVELRANGGNVYALAGNTEGVVKATGVQTSGGRIFLTAEGGTVVTRGKVRATAKPKAAPAEVFINADTVLAAGDIDVSSLTAPGGRVTITGQSIALEGARIDASGLAGGTVLIGGDYQGGAGDRHYADTALPNAQTVSVDAMSTLTLDGLDGDGGDLVIWSDDATGFAGTISARGFGAGDGGFAEVSGKQTLDYSGFADMRSENGMFGDLLLDPGAIYIRDVAGDTDVDLDVGTFESTSAGTGDSVLSRDTLLTALGYSNVFVKTEATHDINLETDLAWDSAGILVLDSGGSIQLDGDITAPAGGLFVRSNTGAFATGDIRLARFLLQRGTWVQDGVLPEFEALDFALDNSTLFQRSTGGNGTAAAPLQIADVYGLQGVASLVRPGSTRGHFRLVNDIDARGTANWRNGEGFVPIGDMTTRFEGSFDGGGHAITGLTITPAGDDLRVGMFGVMDGATVTDLALADVKVVTNAGFVGALAGYTQGLMTLSGLSVTGQVTANADETGRGDEAGGLVGYLAGDAGSTLTDSWTDVDLVQGRLATHAGGIAGTLAGFTVQRVFSTGTIDARDHVGGLFGLAVQSTIEDSWSTASITGSGSSNGGLVGEVGDLTISRSWASGRITASGGGGIYGTEYILDSTTLTDTYWDTVTTGIATASSAGAVTGAAGLNTAQVRQQASYTGLSFATAPGNGTWYMVDGLTRPMLASEYSTTIRNARQLQMIGLGMGSTYALAHDIDLSDALAGVNYGGGAIRYPGLWGARGFAPIAGASDFRGTLDGAGHEIANLTMSTSNLYAGLFERISNGTVRDLTLRDLSISTFGDRPGTSEVIGGVAAVALNNATFDNVHVTGSITSASNVGRSVIGGLVGNSVGSSGEYTDFDDVSFTGSITRTGNVTDVLTVGGLVGGLQVGSRLDGGFVSADIQVSNGVMATNDEIGGAVGLMLSSSAILRNVHTEGSLALSGVAAAGGVIGETQSSASAELMSSVMAISGATYAGGLIGSVESGTMTDGWASGAVSGTIGAGGIIGRDLSGGTASFARLYYDMDTTGATRAAGNSAGAIAGTGGITTAQARTNAGYAGFDFSNDWMRFYNLRPMLRAFIAEPNSDGAIPVDTLYQLQLVHANRNTPHVLTADIDAGRANGLNPADIWGSSGWAPVILNGDFDGGGHVISNLTYNEPTVANIGLFSSLTGNVSRLGLADVNIRAVGRVGPLAGTATGGDITEVWTTGVVSGEFVVGGLVGTREGGTIARSWSTATVGHANALSVGGLVGEMAASDSGTVMEDSWFGGHVFGNRRVGGLVGLASGSGNYAQIYRSLVTGTLTGNIDPAGIVGFATGVTLDAVFWDTTTTGQTLDVGANPPSGTSYGLTTAQMQDLEGADGFYALALAAGWDFDDVWLPPNQAGQGGAGTSATAHYAELQWASDAFTVSTPTGTIAEGSLPAQGLVASFGALRPDQFVTVDSPHITPTGALSAGTYTPAFTGTPTAQTITGETAPRWIVLPGGTLVVGSVAAPLTITPTAIVRTYGDPFAFTGTEFTSTGLQGSDTIASVTLTSIGAGARAPAGTYDIVASNAVFGSGDAGDYDITYETLTGGFTIIPRPLTATIVPDVTTKVYGETLPASLFSLAGITFLDGTSLAPGDSIGSFSAGHGGLHQPTVGVGSYDVQLSALAIFAGGQNRTSSYDITVLDNEDVFTVTPAPLTLTGTLTGATKMYGETLGTFSTTQFTATGLVNGNTIGAIFLNSPDGGAATAGAGSYDLVFQRQTFTNGLARNYDITYVDNTDGLEVTPRPLDLSYAPPQASRVYGAAVISSDLFDLSGFTAVNGTSLAGGDAVSGASFGGSPASASDAPAGSYTLGALGVTISGAGGINTANYTITQVANPDNYTITRRPLDVTIVPYLTSKVYGETISPFDIAGLSSLTTVNGTSLVTGDRFTTLAFDTAGAFEAGAAAGAYTIGIDQIDIRRDGTTRLGSYDVALIDAVGAFAVTPRPLALTPEGVTKRFGTAYSFAGTEFTATGLVNGDSISGVDLASAGAPAGATSGSYDISIANAVFSSGAASNYAIDYQTNVGGFVVQGLAPLTISPLAQVKTYGQAFTFDGTEFTSTGLQGTDAINSVTLTSIATGTGAQAGTYDIVASDAVFGSGDAGNYDITYETLTGGFTVTRAPLTLTATLTGVTKIYGESLGPFASTAFTAAGLVNGDAIGSVRLQSAGGVSIADVGSYDFTIAGQDFAIGSAGNYDISYVDSVDGLEITPRPLDLFFQPLQTSHMYGEAVSFGDIFGLSGISFENGTSLAGSDTIVSAQFSDLSVLGSRPAAGSYTLALTSVSIASAGGDGSGNYAITYLADPGNYTITRRPVDVTITPGVVTKVYGESLSPFDVAGPERLITVNGTSLAAGDVFRGLDFRFSGGDADSPVGTYDIDLRDVAIGRTGVLTTPNYDVTLIDAVDAFTVTPRALTVAPLALTKTYGAAYAFGGTEFTATGLVNGDTIGALTLASVGAARAAGAGSYDITAADAVFSSGTAGNYAISYATLTDGFTVTPRALTVTPLAQTKTYGEAFTFNGTEFTADDLVNGDSIASVTLASAGTARAAGAGSYGITAADAVFSSGTAGNYAITYGTAGFTVTPRALTVAPQAQTKTYGEAFSFDGTEFTAGGLVNGDSIATVLLTSAGAVATAGAGAYDIATGDAVFGSGSAANYAITYGTLTDGLTVARRAIALRPTGTVTATYGEVAAIPGTFELASGSLVNGDRIDSVKVTSAAGNTATANVGSYATLTSAPVFGSGTADNYIITHTALAGGLVRVARALHVRGQDATRTYGDDNPALTAAIFDNPAWSAPEGLVNGDTLTGSVTTLATATSGVGSYSVTRGSLAVADGNGGANYDLRYTPGTLTITPATLTVDVNFPAQNTRVYGDPDGALVYAATGFTAGDTAAILSGAPDRAAGEDVGAYPITLGTLDAGANYTLALLPGDYTITRRALNVAATGSYTRTYGDAGPAPTNYLVTGLAGGDAVGSLTLTSAGTAVTADAGVYDVVPADLVLASGSLGNYDVTYEAGEGIYTVTRRALILTPELVSKRVGDAYGFDGTEFTRAGLVNGDAISGATLASAGAAAGAVAGRYDITISGAVFSSGSASNYAIDYRTRTGGFTVTPLIALSVSPLAQVKTYGRAFAFDGTEFTATGLTGGDAIASVTLTSLATGAGQGVGSYTITASDAVFSAGDAGDYDIGYGTASFIITPAPLAISANAAGKVYGSADGALTWTATGFVAGDGAGVVTGALTRTAGENVGTYAISRGTLDAANYDIAFTGSSFAITPAALSVTANTAGKVYGSADGALTWTATGFVAGDGAGVVTGALTRTAGENVGTYAITRGTLDAANYDIAFTGNSFAITPRAISLRPTDRVSAVYGATAAPGQGFEIAAGSLAFADTITGVTVTSAGSAVTADAGSYAAVTSDPVFGTGSAANYSITHLSLAGALTRTPRPLEIAGGTLTRTYGAANPALTWEIVAGGAGTGLVNGDSLTGAVATAATAASGIGSYAITRGSLAVQDGNGGANYALSYTDGSLTITPRALTVTALSRTKTYGDAVAFDGTGFISGDLVNGDTIASVTLASSGSAATAGVGGYAIDASDAVFGTGSAANYDITYSSGTLTVTPRALTVTALSRAKTYGDAVAFDGTGFTSGDLVNGDTIASVTLASSGSAATAGVGGYAIDASDAVFGTGSAANYDITYSSGTLTVTPRALTVTALSRAKTYGEAVAFDGTGFTSGDLVNGDTIASVTLASSGSAVTAGVGGYAIDASDAVFGTGSAANYDITYASGTLTVTPRALVLTPDLATRAPGSAFTFAGTEFTAAGLVNGDAVQSADLASAGTAAGAAPGQYDITIANAVFSSGSAANYTITYRTRVDGLTVTALTPLTITPLAQVKTYGEAFSFDGTEFASDGLMSGDVIAGVTLVSVATGAGQGAGRYDIVPSAAVFASGNAGAYDITYRTLTGGFTVAPRPISLRPTDIATATYGNSLTLGQGFEVAAGSLVNGDTITSIAVISAGSAATADAGRYASIGTQAVFGSGSAANYAITQLALDGAVTRTPRLLFVRGEDLVRGYGEANPALSPRIVDGGSGAGSEGLVFGHTLTGDLTTAAGIASDVGTYAIARGTLSVADGNGGANYDLRYTDGTLRITPATLRVTADDLAKIYGDADPALTWSATGFRLDDNASILSGALSRAAGENVGAYAIGRGTLDAGANYDIAFSGGVLSITPATLSVTADDLAKIYGDADPALTWSATGFRLDDNASILSGALSRAAGENVGAYAIGQGSLDAGANYDIAFTGGVLSITPATLSVTADDLAKIYGDADPALTWSATGFRLDDNASILSGALSRAAGENVGAYAIGQGSLDAGANYDIAFTGGVLSITPATLSVTADDLAKIYGDADPALTWSATGFRLDDDTSILSGALSRAAGENVGAYAIGQGSLDAGANYDIAFTGGVLSITPATLSVTARPMQSVYGDRIPAPGWTATGFRFADTAALVTGEAATGATAASGVGTYAITRGTLDAGPNYAIAFSEASVTITPRALTGRADDLFKLPGQADPVLTWTLVGGAFVNGDTRASVVTGELARADGEAPGTYAITAGTLSAGPNYLLTVLPGTLRVGAPVPPLRNPDEGGELDRLDLPTGVSNPGDPDACLEGVLGPQCQWLPHPWNRTTGFWRTSATE